MCDSSIIHGSSNASARTFAPTVFLCFLHSPRFTFYKYICCRTASSSTARSSHVYFSCVFVLAEREILINVWKPAQGTMISSTVILTNAAINKHFQEDTQVV